MKRLKKALIAAVAALAMLFGCVAVTTPAEAKQNGYVVVSLAPGQGLVTNSVLLNSWSDESDDYLYQVPKGWEMPIPPTPHKTGYKFDGWWSQWKGGDPITFPLRPTTTVVAHAHWVADNGDSDNNNGNNNNNNNNNGSNDNNVGSNDANDPNNKIPVYRLYNPSLGVHHYTAGEAEKDYLSTHGWNYEGIVFYGVQPNSRNSKAVYRAYNPYVDRHHWTTNWTEYASIQNRGWKGESIAWWVPNSGPVKVWRLYNPNTQEHLYTNSLDEYNILGRIGWNQEGIAWYAK